MAIDNRVTAVMVNLTDIPVIGPAHALVKMSDYDRELVTDAARVIGMSQQKFMRTVLVSAARQTLKEAGIKGV